VGLTRIETSAGLARGALPFIAAVVALAPARSPAHAAGLVLPGKCVVALAKAMPDWRPHAAPADAAAWARERGVDPAIAKGDFDGNGRVNWATLASHRGKARLAICLNPSSSFRLVVVDDPYCADVVYRSKAGTRHHNYETGRVEVLERDGVSVSCFEKAGATYVVERGALRRIIDSD
jgi:hypothetical protein